MFDSVLITPLSLVKQKDSSPSHYYPAIRHACIWSCEKTTCIWLLWNKKKEKKLKRI